MGADAVPAGHCSLPEMRCPAGPAAPLLLAASADRQDGGVQSPVIAGQCGGLPSREMSQLRKDVPALQRHFASGAEQEQDTGTPLFAQIGFFTLRQPLCIVFSSAG